MVNEVAAPTRNWTYDLFAALAAEAGAADPPTLATRLVLLYDGAVVAAQIQRDPTAAATARAMAALVIDAAL